MGKLLKIDSNNFDAEILSSKKPVLLDFWAEWCGPCRALGPVLEEIANEMGESVTVAKINVDENPEIAQKFSIRGIPTMIFFKNGEVKKTLVGNQPKAEISKGLSELI